MWYDPETLPGEAVLSTEAGDVVVADNPLLCDGPEADLGTRFPRVRVRLAMGAES